MTSHSNSITRITTSIALIIAVVITVTIPAAYFALSYKYLKGTISAHAELTARVVDDLVMGNPELWHFEEIRLQELLQYRSSQDVPESRLIRDTGGNIVAQMSQHLTPPLISGNSDIYDAGMVVARVEISQSLAPLITKTAITGLFSFLFGVAIFIILRSIPLRAVNKAYDSMLRSEEALRHSEERFRTMAEALPLTIFEIDLQGRLTYFNKAGMEKFGYTPEDINPGLTISQLVATEDHARLKEVIAMWLETGWKGYVEYQGLRKDGTTFPITVAATAIVRNGLPIGLRGVIVDLIEHKQLEEERIKSQKLESIGTLAGGIAHDFNNLLQGIFGYIEMAKMSLDQKDKSVAMLDQAEKALHQSISLTTQLLTFSKGGKPVKKLINLKNVIENSTKFTLSGSQSVCRIDISPDLWQVEADEGQIGQVIQNITLNADQSMPFGGSVLITAKNIPKAAPQLPHNLTEGKYVQIAIQDTGIGIPEEYIDKIFDPYFTTKEKGSGLGLATSYSIVKNHGGLIDVKSVPGKGTTFYIYLPAPEEKEEGKKEVREDFPLHAVARKGKVLVMDDDELMQKIAKEFISALGHDVELAEHGAAALEKYRAAMDSGRPFDVVILDLTIRSGMGGGETIRRLKEIDPSVRSIVSSGYADSNIVADYKNYGFTARLNKPYKLDTLRDALNSLLSA